MAQQIPRRSNSIYGGFVFPQLFPQSLTAALPDDPVQFAGLHFDKSHLLKSHLDQSHFEGSQSSGLQFKLVFALSLVPGAKKLTGIICTSDTLVFALAAAQDFLFETVWSIAAGAASTDAASAFFCAQMALQAGLG